MRRDQRARGGLLAVRYAGHVEPHVLGQRADIERLGHEPRREVQRRAWSGAAVRGAEVDRVVVQRVLVCARPRRRSRIWLLDSGIWVAIALVRTRLRVEVIARVIPGG